MTQPTTSTSTTAAFEATAAAPQSSRFVWHDLMTTDVPRARAFYAALFGWTSNAVPMGPMTYEMLRAGEQDIGGMVPLDAAHGVPSHWIGYLGVADVDAACAKADAIGGKTCVPPTDIPGVGRFAVVEDSTGAVFSPFRGTGEAPPEPRNPPAGTFAWNELMTTDPAKAAEFYGALTGWTHERMEMPTGTYWLFKRGDAFAAGMMQMPPDAPSRPNWLPYVAVADCDASAATVPELGGQLFVQPTDIRDWGRFAVAQDPTGAVFAMLQSRPM